MPVSAPFANGIPALFLYPLDESFLPKHIALSANQRVKIGRQTNAKTVPGERNGYFDSKVLSRQHAEVWEENGKIFIRDVKSSNGTFINGHRLSAEGVESEPFELNTEDIVEFGIDIVGEDNKTIIHHKVAARVICVFNEQDALSASRAEQNHQATLSAASHAGSSNGSNAFNFAQTQGANSQRRPSLQQQQQGFVGMGGMGAGMRAPGKSGLTFDHILSRLQGELQKSRDTGAELQHLTGAMNEIHDTLGGSLPQPLPVYPHSLPPVRPPQPHVPEPQPEQVPASALHDLQGQLHETQSSLSSHVEKMRALEDILAEHEAMKREVALLRNMMEDRKRDMDSSHRAESRHQYDDDDDTRSVDTVTPHELERVVEEDEEQLVDEDDDERRQRREELGRPRTPEPSSMGMSDEDYEVRQSRRSGSPSNSAQRGSTTDDFSASPMANELAMRIYNLSEQLENALSLSTALQNQHAAAQSTISALESKVAALELVVQAAQAQIHTQEQTVAAVREQQSTLVKESESERRESLTAMLNEWKKGEFTPLREEWDEERQRLNKAREEWETKFKNVELDLGRTVARVDSELSSLKSHTIFGPGRGFMPNGHDAEIVTPPSPRSLSADSNRQRRRRRSTSRGRSRSKSVELDASKDLDTTASELTDSTDAASSTATSLTSMSSAPDDMEENKIMSEMNVSSLHHTDNDAMLRKQGDRRMNLNSIHVSTAFGVVLLSVAAAAVVWRVKPE